MRQPKYGFDQKLYYVWSKWTPLEQTCDVCSGRGTLTADTGDRISCPRCVGIGKSYGRRKTAMVCGPEEVLEIIVRHYKSWPSEVAYELHVLLDPIEEERCFLTAEEAEEEASRINSEVN